MADHRIDRRQILKGAGAIGAVGALAALEGSTAGLAAGHSDAIEGSWIVNSSPDGDRLLYSFTAGGVVIKTRGGSVVSQYPTGALHGAWMSMGGRTFADTTYELRTDQSGTYTGTARVQDRVTLDATGDAFSGSWRFEFYNPDGSLGSSGSGTLKGKRIKVVPL